MSRFFLPILSVFVLAFSWSGYAAQDQVNQPNAPTTEQSATNHPKDKQAEEAKERTGGFLGFGASGDNEHGGTTDSRAEDEYTRRQTDAEESMSEGTWSGAKAAWSSAYATWLATAIAFGSIWFLLWTLCLTKRQTNELIKSNTLLKRANLDARKANESERRPWLSLSIHVARDGLQRTSDLTFFMVYAKVKNCGATPASGVVFFAKIGLLPDVDAFLGALKSFCDPIRETPRMAEIVFPEEERIFPYAVAITDAEISTHFAKSSGAVGQVVVYGCVQYESQYTNAPRQTRFVYHVQRITPEGKQTHLVDQIEKWYGHQIVVLPDVVWKDAD